jgi:pentapeptide MXKDX repeat protein
MTRRSVTAVGVLLLSALTLSGCWDWSRPGTRIAPDSAADDAATDVSVRDARLDGVAPDDALSDSAGDTHDGGPPRDLPPMDDIGPDDGEPGDVGGLDALDAMSPDVMSPDVMSPDVMSPDVMSPDVMSPDVMSPDVMSPDVMSPDVLSPDVLSPDVMSPDVLSPDVLSPDVMSPDLDSPDLGSPLACAVGQPLFVWPAGKMVMCSAGKNITPCGAPAICNTAAGWSLCTASQYLARGGKTTAPPLQDNAWLSGCIRSGGAPYAPTDTLCPGNCKAGSAPAATVAWQCGPGSFTRSDAYLAVLTRTACRRVGVNSAAYEGFWSFRATNQPRPNVVCCN